jgi:hypothetical protein
LICYIGKSLVNKESQTLFLAIEFQKLLDVGALWMYHRAEYT